MLAFVAQPVGSARSAYMSCGARNTANACSVLGGGTPERDAVVEVVTIVASVGYVSGETARRYIEHQWDAV